MLNVMLDVDNTLVETTAEALRLFGLKKNIIIPPNTIFDYDLSSLGIEMSVFEQVNYLDLNIVPDIEQLKELSKKCNLYFLTSNSYRGCLIHNDTKLKFLEEFTNKIGLNFSNIIIAENKGLVMGDVLVDDYVWNLNKFRGSVKILYKRSWSRPDLLKGCCYEASDWEQVFAILEEVLRANNDARI